MNKIDLGQVIQMLGNLGVVLGILLLVYELNQNRQMMQAQTRSSIAQATSSLIVEMSSNPAMVDAMLKEAAGETLDRREAFLLDLQNRALWRHRENISYQNRMGLYEEGEYLGQRRGWIRELNTDSRERTDWCSRAVDLSEDFIAELDSLLDEPCE
jgi:hypothetical protein